MEENVSEGSIVSLPRWIRIANRLYTNWGLKTVLLLLLLTVYQVVGALVFYLCEASNDRIRASKFDEKLGKNRTIFVENVVENLKTINFFINQTNEKSWESGLRSYLQQELIRYEFQFRQNYQRPKWDFWNAMLYAQSIYTTIGYGHLFANTVAGRIATMVYALMGIPLLLTILDDLGKIITRALKTPWYLIKYCVRRMFRHFTKTTANQMYKMEMEDRRRLKSTELSIPFALIAMFAWIIICSATFCIWENSWTFFTSFYFFFISLSTIGLGDITPSKPKYLIILSIYIIVGLSLVSICVNQIQSRFRQNYDQLARTEMFVGPGNIANQSLSHGMTRKSEIVRNASSGSSLGIFRSQSASKKGITRESFQAHLLSRTRQQKCSQTILSFPVRLENTIVKRTISQAGMKLLPRSLSIDDVVKLVDTEEVDLVLLANMNRMTREEVSGISELSRTTASTTTTSETHHESSPSSEQIDLSLSDSTLMMLSRAIDEPAPLIVPLSVPSNYIQHLIENAHQTSSASAEKFLFNPGTRPKNISDLEYLEELEDTMLLMAQGALPNPSTTANVHFRSRLSLIPEQHSIENTDSSSKELESSIHNELSASFGEVDKPYSNSYTKSDKFICQSRKRVLPSSIHPRRNAKNHTKLKRHKNYTPTDSDSTGTESSKSQKDQKSSSRLSNYKQKIQSHKI